MPRYATYATPRADLGVALYEYIISQDDYIGIQAAATTPVPEKAATFSKVQRESLLRDQDLTRASGGGYNRDQADMEDQAYACLEYGLEGLLDDSDREHYKNDFDAEEVTTTMTLHALLRGQERRWATALFNTTTWTGSTLYTDYSSSAPWTTTSSDVLLQINAAKEAVINLTGMEPRTLIINLRSMNLLANNDDLIARAMYTSEVGHAFMAAALARLLDLDRVLVGRAVRNTADEGSDLSVSPVWSNLYAMLAVTAETGSLNLKQPCVARSMLWSGDSGTNVVVEQYRAEHRRSDVFRVRQHVDELVIDASYAHLMKIAAS